MNTPSTPSNTSASPPPHPSSNGSAVAAVGRLRRSTTFKLIVLGFVLLGLSIGAAMIRSTVSERLRRSFHAQTEITSSWGGPQVIVGPTLMLETTTACPAREETSRTGAVVTVRDSAPCTYRRALLARSLEWTSTMEPEVRKRGLFRALLYEGRVQGVGEFVVPEELAHNESDSRESLTDAADAVWLARSVWVGVSDLQGLVKVDIELNGRPLSISGSPSENSIDRVVAEPLGDVIQPGDRLGFTIDLQLRGSQALHFVPSAAESQVTIASSWNSPKFTGSLLPATREVGEGFRANWITTPLRRFAPELGPLEWTKVRSQVFDGAEKAAFGVDLIFEAGPHQKVDRALKYAVLLVGMILATVFLLETLSSVRLHPIQYLMIGCAKLLFFLLLLAISEHGGFDLAFWVAAAGCSLMITTYAHAQLRNRRSTTTLAIALALLFSYLFVTLSAETFALLIGALGLFVMLALVMFATRKINWYDIGGERT